MNNYYILKYITDHLNQKLENANFAFSISPHRNVWEAYFYKNDTGNNGFRVIFSSTPGETALFTDQYRAPKKSNVVNFFEPLVEKKVKDVKLAEGDRLLTIRFHNSPALLFQLFGNKANVFLVKNDTIIDSFKNKNELEGKEVPRPRKPRDKGDPSPGLNARQLLLHYDQKLPRHLLDPIIGHYKLENAGAGRAREVVEMLTEAMINRPTFRVLSNGNLCIIPDDLLPLENRKTFDNINEAVKFAYYKASHLRRFDKRVQSIRPKLVKSLKKARKAIQQLEKADKANERADHYEECGHLLMAHAHKDHDRSKESIEVDDFYSEQERRKIELNPTLSIAENAKEYYDRAAKARRRIVESKRRDKEIKNEIDNLEKILESLDRVNNLYEFQDWEKKHEEQLMELGIGGGTGQRKSTPYYKTEFDGYEIWIGKNAKSNDKLTSAAHKEDIWLHARGASGSHVVIRMNNTPEKPPMHVIHRAASYAAWHSKMRGSQLVPVIFTKRKYVIKSKGTPAGAVRVQREEVVMAEPQEPEKQ